ncbi:unnamed protein product, partial [Ectocarpus sp. 12 AP-2014]
MFSPRLFFVEDRFAVIVSTGHDRARNQKHQLSINHELVCMSLFKQRRQRAASKIDVRSNLPTAWLVNLWCTAVACAHVPGKTLRLATAPLDLCLFYLDLCLIVLGKCVCALAPLSAACVGIWCEFA